MINDRFINTFDAKYFCIVNEAFLNNITAAIKNSQRKESSAPEKRAVELLNESAVANDNRMIQYTDLGTPDDWPWYKKLLKKWVMSTYDGWNKSAEIAKKQMDVTSSIKDTDTFKHLEQNYADRVKRDIESGGTGNVGVPATDMVQFLARQGFDKVEKIGSSPAVDSSILRNAGGVAGNMQDTASSVIDKVSNNTFLNKIGKFIIEHPMLISLVSTFGYLAVNTFHIWFPYMKRLAYELMNDAPIACVKFDSYEDSYTLEYTLSRGRWVLIKNGKLAGTEDIMQLTGTEFANKFLNRCRELMIRFFDSPEIQIVADAVKNNKFYDIDEDVYEQIGYLFENRRLIETKMYSFLF